MSWNPFGRQAKRNLISKTAERDYERECTKVQHLEDASKKVCKDSKKTIVALDAFGKSSGKIGQDLSTDLSGNAPANVKLFEFALCKQEQLAQSESSIMQRTWVDPAKKFNSVFPYYSSQVKTRDKALQEYAKVQIKFEKHEEKEHTAANSVKIEQVKREMQPVKEDFEQKNGILVVDMPNFYDARIDYFLPAAEASLFSKCWMHAQAIKAFDNCLRDMDVEIGDRGDLKIKNLLDEIRLLSITSDD